MRQTTLRFHSIIFLSMVWLCGQGRTPPRIYVCFADFLAKWNKKNTALPPQDNPGGIASGAPTAGPFSNLRRGQPSRITHYTCFTSGVPLQGAGGWPRTAPCASSTRGDVGSGNLRPGTGPRFCRHGGVQEDRRSPTFSCGVLPSLHPWGRRPMPAGAGAADRNTRRSPA